MATLSSLISEINSLLQTYADPPYFPDVEPMVRIALRNLKVHLVCLRNLGDADKRQSLLPKLEVAIEEALAISGDGAQYKCMLIILNVNAECEWDTNTISDHHLTMDDVIEVADSLLDSTTDFWALTSFFSFKASKQANPREVMDEVEVQIRFMRGILILAKWAAVETRSLLIHLCPFVLKASHMFIMDRSSTHVYFYGYADWFKGVQLKCPTLDPQVFQSYTQTLASMSTLNILTDDADAVLMDFLNSLIPLVWHILRFRSDSLKPLYECLRLSRSNLKRNNYGDFKAQIGVLVRDAGILVCSVYLSGVDSAFLSDLLQRFDLVQTQVLLVSTSLRESVLDFGDSTTMEEVSELKVEIDASVAGTSIPRVVGIQDEVTLILDRLVRGSKQLRLVPISGMAGLGKTTFALEIYNLRSVRYHFQARAWCTISQVFDKKKVLIQLLNQIQPGGYSNMMEDDMANQLRRSLKGKRYLILLDDVWTPQVWESLGPSFPDDATQSRVIFTSRLHAITPLARPDEQTHFLRLRTEIECLKIIEMKLLHNAVGGIPQENTAQSSVELEKFAKLCKGLPLTAVLIAGLLSTTVHEGWDSILELFNSGGISQMERCKIALELSYKQLPDYLKLCFMYFGIFPEDQEICAKRLIRLWMAEGFVAERNHLLKMRIQDIAQGYLDELIQRNLVMVATKKSIGGVKECRIHDLLHSFCMMKGKEENLFHCLLQKHDRLSDFNEPHNLVRLSIHSTAHQFLESKLFCPRAHSMLHFNSEWYAEYFGLCDMLFVVQIYKHLRVLDLNCIWFNDEVPSEIGLLTRLTYLCIRSRGATIPASIGNLSNLETLMVILSTHEAVSLPHTIWDLQNLKCLYITLHGSTYAGFSLPIENLENSPNLLDLESVCGVLFYTDKCGEKPMMKFPNIRKLKCHVLCGGENLEELNKIVVVPEFLSQLEILGLSTVRGLHYQFDFVSVAENLKKVTLREFTLSREEIAVIGRLPKLEVLKLVNIIFVGGDIEMEEGEFLKLRVLKFIDSSWHLETWTINGDEELPCLEKLVFQHCAKLKEIPSSCLENSSTLEEIEVYYCSSALEIFARNIEEIQKDLGNSISVQINSIPDSGMEEEDDEEEEEEEE